MKIVKFINRKNGNVSAIVKKSKFEEDVYEIAKNADNYQPYGICLPNTDFFIPISKGKGKAIYSKIVAEIEKNKAIPVFEEHCFNAIGSNDNFCSICGQYLTDKTHTRSN